QWVLDGTVPPGMTFKKNPASTDTREYGLYGAPTQTGHYTFSITATDSSSSPRTLTKNYAVDVENAQVNLPTTLVPVGTVGAPYSYTFTPTGGAAPFYFQMGNGPFPVTLPAGLSFDNTLGTLSGTPTQAAYLYFTLTLSDSSFPNRQSVRSDYSLLISPKPLSPRNDTIATATAIVPGSYIASISPYGDPPGTTEPDQDYYELTAT